MYDIVKHHHEIIYFYKFHIEHENVCISLYIKNDILH